MFKDVQCEYRWSHTHIKLIVQFLPNVFQHCIVDGCNSFRYSGLQFIHIFWKERHIHQSFHKSPQKKSQGVRSGDQFHLTTVHSSADIFFFFFRLLPFRGRHSGCLQASAQKIWQCFSRMPFLTQPTDSREI